MTNKISSLVINKSRPQNADNKGIRFCMSFATTHNLSFFHKIVNWLFSLEYTNALL